MKVLIKSIYFKILVGVVVIAILFSIFSKPEGFDVDTGQITRGKFSLEIEEICYTKVIEKYSLYAPVSGILKRIHLRVGDRVNKGDLLAIVNWDFDRLMYSPISGTILRIIRQSEGPVAMGMPILDLGDLSAMEIYSEVLSKSAGEIQIGDPVEITGFGETTLNGKVKSVEPIAFTKVSTLGVEEKRVNVLIDFPIQEKLGDGYQLKCKILTGIVENSLLIPSASLFREEKDWYVFQKKDGKASRVKVEISGRNTNYARLISGLKENDSVILYPGDNIKEGVYLKE